MLTEAARTPGLDDDEQLFSDSVYEFADREVRPLVGDMDERAEFPRSLVDALFELGVMGIEIPETYGGAGGTFFQASWRSKSWRGSTPPVAVLVDVQNTLCQQRAGPRGERAADRSGTCPRWPPNTVGAYAMSEAGSGAMRLRWPRTPSSTGRRLRPQRAEDVDHQRRRSGRVPRLRQRATRMPGTRASPRSSSTALPGFRFGKKEDKLGIRASSRAS